ncbi:MAG TPA: BolA family protein [Rhizomicrobium sp.]|jgi:BolA protein|nr:BolA family protein [Rhizomicrobium sp.]
MSVADEIRRKLVEAFRPSQIDVNDESALHAGHAGARPAGETHFRVRIVAPAFIDMSRVARQRKIYEVLSAEMHGQIHALSIEARAPGE